MSTLVVLYAIEIYCDCNCKLNLANNFKTEPERTRREELGNKIKLGSPGLHINIHRDEMFSLQLEKLFLSYGPEFG